jgi:polyketide cyclase/dehydrase/lipid transport protein
MTTEEPRSGERVTTIPVTQDTTVPPERVLGAARDFSDRRAKVFPAVSARHMTVHSVEDGTADVTEGTRVGPFVVWERCVYDWSKPGCVTATVVDSNVYGFPGSSWEITAVPTDRGSRVSMTWTRCFQRRPLGRIMGFAYRHMGERSFTKYGRDIVKNLEDLEKA